MNQFQFVTFFLYFHLILNIYRKLNELQRIEKFTKFQD